MSDKGSHRTFDDPIPLPDGGELRTLRDAGNFIAKLPKREHDCVYRKLKLGRNGGEGPPKDGV